MHRHSPDRRSDPVISVRVCEFPIVSGAFDDALDVAMKPERVTKQSTSNVSTRKL